MGQAKRRTVKGRDPRTRPTRNLRLLKRRPRYIDYQNINFKMSYFCLKLVQKNNALFDGYFKHGLKIDLKLFNIFLFAFVISGKW